MDCADRQEQVSLLLDGELEAGLEAGVFRHLGECAECRAFQAAALRLQRAVRLDAGAAGPEADGIALPAPRSRPSARESAPSARFRTGPAGWRLPAPAAIALATALLATGALLGAGLGGARGGPAPGRAPVVVVCSLPQVEVR